MKMPTTYVLTMHHRDSGAMLDIVFHAPNVEHEDDIIQELADVLNPDVFATVYDVYGKPLYDIQDNHWSAYPLATKIPAPPSILELLAARQRYQWN